MRCRLTRSARLAYAAAAFAALLNLFPAATVPAAAQATSGGKTVVNTSRKTVSVAAQSVAPASAAVSVLFAGNPLPIPSPAHAPYRDVADGLLCIVPESLAPLGITFIVDERADKVSLMGPEGASVTVDIRRPAAAGNEKPRRGNHPVFVPVAEVIEGLGGSCVYDASKTKLSIRGALSSVEMLGGQLRVKAAFPVTPKVFRMDGRRKVVIDVPGAEIGKLPTSLPLTGPNLKQARCGQFQPDVARIVLELDVPGDFTPLDVKPTTQLVLNPVATPTPMPSVPAAVVSSATPQKPVTTARKGGVPVPPTVLSGVTLRPIDDKKVQIVLAAGRVPEVRTNLSNGQLTLDLANTTLGTAAASALGPVQHPLLRAVQVLAPGAGTARLVVGLSRMVTYTVRPNGTRGLIIELGLPRGAGGKLAGKLVIVDAGHGGTDSGARGVNGTYEKNNNLAIAHLLADNLRDAGANVIMTRATDVFIPLGERSHIANRAGADFFLSVHCDSTGGRNRTINGSTVYYHLNVASCKALAQSIAERLAAEVGTIRSKGIRSDGVIYPGSGFSVLRRSQMVSVLVETGYMTNPNDARYLSDPATRKRIASAIASGLRDYIEGNPYVDTRNINPQPESPWSTLPEGEIPEAPTEVENAAPTNVSSIR